MTKQHEKESNFINHERKKLEKHVKEEEEMLETKGTSSPHSVESVAAVEEEVQNAVDEKGWNFGTIFRYLILSYVFAKVFTAASNPTSSTLSTSTTTTTTTIQSMNEEHQLLAATASSSGSSSSFSSSEPRLNVRPKYPCGNLFATNVPMRMDVYVQTTTSVPMTPDETFNASLLWSIPYLTYDGNESQEFVYNVTDLSYAKLVGLDSFSDVDAKRLDPDAHSHQLHDHDVNATLLYLRVSMTQLGFSSDPNQDTFDASRIVSQVFPLTVYQSKRKVKVTRNLLGKDAAAAARVNDRSDHERGDDKEEKDKASSLLSSSITEAPMDALVAAADGAPQLHWKRQIQINPIYDQTVYTTRSPIPAVLHPYVKLRLNTEHQQSSYPSHYYPILYVNDFWLLTEELLPMNHTQELLPLQLKVYPLSLWKFLLYTQMQQSFENQVAAGSQTLSSVDSMKRMFVETNPYLLAVTLVVSLLHTVFDVLAFKNDVNFWRKQKSLEGLSLRTMLLNTFFQVVIFLYLLDNDTSYMILVSSGVGLLIEFWKIGKSLQFTFNQKDYSITYKTAESYSKSNTATHDEVAVTHLSYIMYPLIVGYAMYTLLYSQHKSWYSWVLSSLTGFVYAFGFIMMCPQLYINYKLKSVAHLPWRAMVYKSLNTFIDDLFAFVIKMPWMHRLSCFRDDIIFFIYLYQRWIYPVDKKRVNEFGQVMKAEDDHPQRDEKPSSPSSLLLVQQGNEMSESKELDQTSTMNTPSSLDENTYSTTGASTTIRRSKFSR